MRTTVERFRDRATTAALQIAGMARRVVVGLASSDGFWQLIGLKDAEGNVERFSHVELFQGVGFHARPGSGKAEAIVLHIGGDEDHPVIVATRDRSIQVELDADETAIFNSQTIVKLTSGGDVRIGSANATEPVIRGNSFNSSVASPLVTATAAMASATATAAGLLPAATTAPLLQALLTPWFSALATYLGAISTAFAAVPTTVSPKVKVQ